MDVPLTTTAALLSVGAVLSVCASAVLGSARAPESASSAAAARARAERTSPRRATGAGAGPVDRPAAVAAYL